MARVGGTSSGGVAWCCGSRDEGSQYAGTLTKTENNTDMFRYPSFPKKIKTLDGPTPIMSLKEVILDIDMVSKNNFVCCFLL